MLEVEIKLSLPAHRQLRCYLRLGRGNIWKPHWGLHRIESWHRRLTAGWGGSWFTIDYIGAWQ